MPYSRDIIDSMTEVRYVTELNAGITAKLGIKPGDKVDECDNREEKWARSLQPGLARRRLSAVTLVSVRPQTVNR
ncbi:putative conserved protein [Rhizobium favelukesii]|uniref:Conserved protein n=1 Tax=Rhizobium favelukesii TaxID=348824 RepID=W6RTH1_9HYPH|nr:putative conserved protein [Rhizobium favelukesii]